ncbi:MAG TPA: DUF1499 domain-containing protein [Gemmatimonadales bacterium]|nr:DUF1499 domain-containing protein [Gemmatimonadales bacterium]
MTRRGARTAATLLACAGVLTTGALAACSPDRPSSDLPGPREVMTLLAEGNSRNVAATSDTATDPRLKPRAYPLPPIDVAHAVVDAIDSLPRWDVIAGRDGVIWATHRARVLPLVDDVYLLLVPGHDSTVVYARSASRGTMSDLGQNRRNLGELWPALDAAVRQRSGQRP